MISRFLRTLQEWVSFDATTLQRIFCSVVKAGSDTKHATTLQRYIATYVDYIIYKIIKRIILPRPGTSCPGG